MKDTTLGIPTGPNYVSSYIALTDSTPYRIPPPMLNDGEVVGVAGGCKSSVNDLLKYYGQIMKVNEQQLRTGSVNASTTLFPKLHNIWKSQMPVAEGSDYGFGWVLTELPGKVGMVGVNAYPVHLGAAGMPAICRGIESKHRLVYHNGTMIGAQSSVYLLPDSQTAVVVLSNTLGLVDTPDWVGQLILEAILDVPRNKRTDFVSYAKATRKAVLSLHPATQKRLIDEQVLHTSHKPLDAYAGRYTNGPGYFSVDVSVELAAGGKVALRMTIQGIPEVYYSLYHYNYDTFAFGCDRDEESKKCFFPQAQIGLHRIQFNVNKDEDV